MGRGGRKDKWSGKEKVGEWEAKQALLLNHKRTDFGRRGTFMQPVSLFAHTVILEEEKRAKTGFMVI